MLNGKWTLERVLGAGGASTVYEAVHRDGHRAAVKVMARKRIRDTPALEVAEHEARVANSVHHRGVVRILDEDLTEDGSAYLVMELLEGETLEARRRLAGGRLKVLEALLLFEQLLDVLAAAHDVGIIHRDIKPDNLFVTTHGQLKVLDFGLAAARGERERARAPWFGTPGFMPPEQARADWLEVDALSDLWAAAATFYTVLTGQHVHRATTLAELLRAAACDDIDLAPLQAAVAPRIFDFFERALATDKDDRFPSARAMLHGLRNAVRSCASSTLSGPQRSHLPIAVPPVHCHSTTRVFRLDDAPGCDDAATAPARRGVACVMCPVCPADVATVQRAG